MGTGLWKHLYGQLREIEPGTFVTWETVEHMTNRPHNGCRASLVRARQELECQDGMTLTGQCAEGFRIVRQEDA